MAKITFGTANSRKLNEHHIPITSIGTFSVNARQVTGCIPLNRGEKIKCNYSQFSRLAPLVAPTFGSFNIKTMAFFVPAHTIWRGYRSWVSGSVDSSVPNAPLNFSMEDLVYLITGSSNPTSSTDWSSPYVMASDQNYKSAPSGSDWAPFNGNDFVVYDSYSGVNQAHGGNFTSAGRELWNTLICLGYNFSTFIKFSSELSGGANVDTLYYGLENSVYPLLAYARVCYDYLYPSRYVNQQGFSFLFETSLNNSWANQSTRRTLIEKMISTWFNQYDQDFYTSLWSRPNQAAVGSNQGVVPNFKADPTYINNHGIFSTSSQANSRVVSGDAGAVLNSTTQLDGSAYQQQVYNLSAQSLRWLTSVSDFVLRNNIGGARFREFMKSHFGYNTKNDTCDESIYIKTFSDQVKIQDVTNMTSGDQMGALGELAGKGYSSSKPDYSFSYDADEAGFLIFVSECKPNVGYYQGNRPWARALTDRFQLYTPEFDGVGMEGVPVRAVMNSFSSYDDTLKVQSGLNDAFGFAPRYSERYKIGHDNLFGDFRFHSRGQYLDSWHTMRDVLYGRTSSNKLALDAAFLSVDNQYQRIFRYIGGSSDGVTYDVEDKIWCFLGFDITKYSSAKNLGNSLPFFMQNGRDAHMNYEGSDIK